ncbi:MAG TPA: alkaline phosphatase family protein [Spirochaetota bacterium]|nr:alkaline phosphatase family protein [Spirochaetota bacterium]
MSGRRFIFFFIDGIGVNSNEQNNPFLIPENKFFLQSLKGTTAIPFNGNIKKIDASLKTPGIPQSATGQTSLFSGINAAQYLGCHLTAFPNQKLRALLIKKNILKQFINAGKKAVFINTYPVARDIMQDIKIDRGGRISDSKRSARIAHRLSATTVMALSTGQLFFNARDLMNERSVYQDFTNELLKNRIPGIQRFTPQRAGSVLAHNHLSYDLTLYEYFQTDKAGHSREPARCREQVKRLNLFLTGLLQNLDLTVTTLIVTSDHGNMEDLSTGAHTCNPVPLLVWGPEKKKILQSESLVDIVPQLNKAASLK